MSDSGENRIEGVSGRIAPAHHVGFDKALEEAVALAADDSNWEPGQVRTYSVELSIEVVKTNPGWIGSYKATLTPGG
jgi:hypothetical protein